MSDIETAAPRAQTQALSIAEGAEKLAADRNAGAVEANISAAARAMSQRAAEARLARRAEAAGQTTVAVDEDPMFSSEDVTDQGGVEASNDELGSQAGLIDLGDGVAVTLDQVREGFMLKADHTRKTQALAEERRALEAARAQKLAALDQALAQIQQHTPAPKTLQAYLAEDPANGLARFAQQVDRMQQLAAMRDLARQQRDEHVAAATAARDRHLAESYWSTREDAQKGVADAAQYARTYGYDDGDVAAAMVDPAIVAILDKARKFDELQAGKARIERFVADKPKVVRPGAKVTSQAASQSAAANARARLRSSGSLSDAVAYLQAQRKTRGT